MSYIHVPYIGSSLYVSKRWNDFFPLPKLYQLIYWSGTQIMMIIIIMITVGFYFTHVWHTWHSWCSTIDPGLIAWWLRLWFSSLLRNEFLPGTHIYLTWVECGISRLMSCPRTSLLWQGFEPVPCGSQSGDLSTRQQHLYFNHEISGCKNEYKSQIKPSWFFF